MAIILLHFCMYFSPGVLFFFFNDTATTEIYTLSLHDALPISARASSTGRPRSWSPACGSTSMRSEEHTSELQSHHDLVCRLLLEKKKKHTKGGMKKKRGGRGEQEGTGKEQE